VGRLNETNIHNYSSLELVRACVLLVYILLKKKASFLLATAALGL
jgi:hypothetical protein